MDYPTIIANINFPKINNSSLYRYEKVKSLDQHAMLKKKLCVCWVDYHEIGN
jgi:hypothetical protein